MRNQTHTIQRLERAVNVVARHAVQNFSALPIFARLDAELTAMAGMREAKRAGDPVTIARALCAAERALCEAEAGEGATT